MRGLLAALLLGSCAAQDLVYAGEVTPRAGTCDAASRGTLSIRHGAVIFTPSSGVLILTGRMAPDGTIAATLVRPGMDKAPYRLSLQAALAGDAITGTYATPRCRYAVHLLKAS